MKAIYASFWIAIDCYLCQKFSGRDFWVWLWAKKWRDSLAARVRSGKLENLLISSFQISFYASVSQLEGADIGETFYSQSAQGGFLKLGTTDTSFGETQKLLNLSLYYIDHFQVIFP